MDDLKTLLKLAESGDKKSQLKLAKRYQQLQLNATQVEEYLTNEEESLKWYRILAESNVGDKLDESFYAKWELIESLWALTVSDEFRMNGEYYSNYKYYPNYEDNMWILTIEYLKWCLAAITDLDLDRIKQNYPAFYLEEKKENILGYICWAYNDFPEIISETISYAKQSALLGVKEAAEILGYHYVTDDEDEALKWFTQGKCYYSIGSIYKYSKSQQDYSKALEYFHLEIKNNSDYNIAACLELGELYYNGWGTPKNFKKAAEWYHSFFTQSSFIDAVTEHTYILESGVNKGDKDWYAESLLPEEILEMGDSYLYNGELKEGLDFFFSIYRKTIDEILQAEITYRIAKIYDFKLNDKIKAIYYYKQLVRLGNTNALNKLEDIYLFIRNHEEKALEWFKQKDTSEFYYILGLLYKKGEGFKQDYSKALSAFELAANTKYKYTNDYSLSAMFELGEFYYNGYGVPVNYEKAAKWYQLLIDKRFSWRNWRNAPSSGWYIIDDYEYSRYRTLQIQDSGLELPFQSAENDSVPF